MTGRKTAARLIVCATLSGMAVLPGAAQQMADGLVLDTVVVTAGTDGTGGQGMQAESSVGGQQLELRFPGATMTRILETLPSIQMNTSADEPGMGVNIRGLQDFGRVAVLIDGARQNFQRNGHSANGTFYVDTEMLGSVDSTRGPGATVHGSGAIGGVVSMTTVGADDIIREGAERGARLRFGLDTNGPGPTVNLIGATRIGEDADLLAGFTYKDLRDYTSASGVREPSAETMRSGLVKGTWRLDDGRTLAFSASRYMNSYLSGNPSRTNPTMRDVDVTVDTVTFGHDFISPDSDLVDLHAKAYWNRTDMEVHREASGAFEESFQVKTLGADLYNTARFATGGVEHELTAGVDLVRDLVTTVDALGDSGGVTPSGRRLAWGAYVQDRMTFSPWFEVIAGMRYDSYRLESRTPGALYGTTITGNRVSPKITLGFTPSESTRFYVSYAEGFRGPALTETVIDGSHPGIYFRFFPNPDLRPEIARTIEAGVTRDFDGLIRQDDHLTTSLTVFRNEIKDFISSEFIYTADDFGTQYRNIDKVRIHGIELEASYDSDRFFGSVSGQILDGKILQHSSHDDSRFPLYDEQARIPPNRLVVTAGFKALEQRLQAGARLTVVGAKDASWEGQGRSDGHEVVDLFAHYRFRENISGSIAVNNVFDREYYEYLKTNLSPGVNAKAVLTVGF